ncbi:uncharacterized protein LOC120428722 [Culex pipiens pallens]|uniref:uncharacterized protein LOC120428722 n=1 Tax=Culex pipiens pallens TaxID=42434 RepID=UPI0019538B2B|nr:uncharacterized protein LOC120428722 [Culex pipiens pallens]
MAITLDDLKEAFFVVFFFDLSAAISVRQNLFPTQSVSHGLIQLRDWIRSILGTLQFAHPPGVLIIRRSVCSLRAVATTAVMAADVFLRYLEKDNRHEYNKLSFSGHSSGHQICH